jgi:hypothetical protein
MSITPCLAKRKTVVPPSTSESTIGPRDLKAALKAIQTPAPKRPEGDGLTDRLRRLDDEMPALGGKAK